MENVYTINREAIIDIFSVWKDSYLLSPEDYTNEELEPELQADEFIRIHEQLQKED